MTKGFSLPVLTLAVATLAAGPRADAHDEAHVLALATRTLEDMAATPNSGVPIGLLRQSEGVILVPNMINAGFIFGAKIGRGVFLVRDSRGRWGNPVFVHVSGGSFGLQAGAQATELLMVFRSKDTVTRLLAGKGKITLGVDAGVAAGPTGTNVGANTDLEMRAEILSYAKSRGLFAGASLGGSGINVDRHQDAVYYDNFAVTTFQIIEGENVVVPVDAAKLKAVLTMLTDPPPPPAGIDEAAPPDASVTRSSRPRDTATTARARPRRRAELNEEDLPRRATDEPDDLPRSARGTPPARPAPPAEELPAEPAPRSARSNRRPGPTTEPGYERPF